MKSISHHYLEAAHSHNLRDEEYVAIPLLIKTDTGHPPTGAHLNCFLNPVEGEELDQLLIKQAAVNAYRT